MTALGTSSLALGLSKLVPIAVAVAILLAIVTFSYRQTIFAYPNGGGSYIVSRENLGETPALVAGASLLVDYVLTVAVSISAGVAAILSIPTFRGLGDKRVLMCLVMIAFITVANLRGAKESGRLFALPTYLYIFTLGVMLAIGLFQTYFGDIGKVPFDPERSEGARQTGGALSLFLLPAGVLVGSGRPERGRGHLQRCARLPQAGGQERGHHPPVHVGDPGDALLRHLRARPPPRALSDPRGDGPLPDGPGGPRASAPTTGSSSSPPPPSWSWRPTPPTPISPVSPRSSPATATCPGSSPTAATGWCSPTAWCSWRWPPPG